MSGIFMRLGLPVALAGAAVAYAAPMLAADAGPFAVPSGTLKIMVPQVTGMEVSRVLDLPKGQSLPHWDYQPMIRLNNAILDGATGNAGLVRADTWSHNENQTFDVMVWRRNYSQGDNYLVDARFTYMGDGHSASGDVHNVLYAASVISDTAIFRGTVETWNPSAGELVYKSGAKAGTLASGRPLINLNPAKWIASGKAWVNSPGGALLGWGGTVKSTDPAWTPDVVGRYFAVDEPGEYVPGGDKVRRWWPITGFAADSNGVKRLSFQRHWWGAKDGNSIGRLYKASHYTGDDANPRLLRYIIAPGVNVYDVSQGVSSAQVNPDGCPRLLRLAPAPFTGTAADFAPGDPIEQAIGPDPFKPIPFRSWLWDAVPGIFNAPVFDVANRGVQRHAVMTVGGGSGSLAADRAGRPDGNPPFNTMVRFQAASRQGIRFEGDTAGSALLFLQPRLADGLPQTLNWAGNIPRRLGMDDNGRLAVSPGAPLDLAGKPVSEAAGLSGQSVRSANLRGIHEPVARGETRARIVFPLKETDSGYALVVRPSWPTDHAVAEQTVAGFGVVFDQPAPEGASLDWVLTH